METVAEDTTTQAPSVRRGGAFALRIERTLAGLVVVGPAVGTAVAFAWKGAHESPLRDGLLFFVLYLVTGFGITIGYHRYFTHRSFEAKPWLRVALAIAGSLALEGPVIRWVADHRRHHQFSDREGDPHSPVTGGFWHAHVLWFFGSEKSRPSRYARDLLSDRTLRWVDKNYLLWMVASLALPFLVGLAFGHTLKAGLSALLWGGFARLFFVHHVTWCINSVCHVVGARPYQSKDDSRNVWWLAIPSLGESWHNAHHAFPTSSVHGLGRWQIDPSATVIKLFTLLGWAKDAKVPSMDAKASKMRVED